MDPFYIKLYSKKPSNDLKTEIVKVFYDHQAQNRYGTIDKILAEINFNRLEDGIINLILRSNESIKDKLYFWKPFVAKAQQKNPTLVEFLEKE